MDNEFVLPGGIFSGIDSEIIDLNNDRFWRYDIAIKKLTSEDLIYELNRTRKVVAFSYELQKKLKGDLAAHRNGVIAKKIEEELSSCEDERVYIVDRFYRLQKEVAKRKLVGRVLPDLTFELV